MARPRMTRSERREQLLDVAAAMLVQSGPSGLTMEGLAARAGVSKALPYSHFDNAEGVVAALRARELAAFAEHILVAVEGVDDPNDAIRSAVHAYFDVVTERGHVLRHLTALEPSQDTGAPRASTEFVAELVQRLFGLRRKRARLAAEMIQATLLGGVTSLVHGDASRTVVEEVASVAVLAIVRAAANGGAAIRPPVRRRGGVPGLV